MSREKGEFRVLRHEEGRFLIQNCYIRVDDDGIWIEALHMDTEGVRATIESCSLHMPEVAVGKVVFAFDSDRKRLEDTEALVRILVCSKIKMKRVVEIEGAEETE